MREQTGYKRILTIQDISCVGQCSLTVALPILSACGFETAVLPSAVLSTHTGGFTGYTFRDLTDDMPAILRHWKKEGFMFDGFCTGYIGSIKQIGYIKEIIKDRGTPGSIAVIDPVLGDYGELYAGFDMDYVEAVKDLCADADVILPNLTEACVMTGTPYKEKFSRDEIEALMEKLLLVTRGTVILKGISFREGMTGVLARGGKLCGGVDEDRAEKTATVADMEKAAIPGYYEHRLINDRFHGTGDIFTAVFTGALMSGLDAGRAAQTAADFVVMSIEATDDNASHRYGVRFEKVLPLLADMIKNVE